MRQWLDLFEDDEFDHAEDERLSAVYARERHITLLIVKTAQDAGLEIEGRPLYDEEDNRSAVIRIGGGVSLEQVETLKGLGSNIMINGNSNGYGVQIELNVDPSLDPTPKLKRIGL
jgi:hypothetical protein